MSDAAMVAVRGQILKRNLRFDYEALDPKSAEYRIHPL
jgi:hypothetical protein